MPSEEIQQILIYAPIPPPYAGPEVATRLLLTATPRQQIHTHHVVSNIRKSNNDKGRFDVKGLMVFFGNYFRFITKLLTTRSTKVYLLLSSSRVAFLRDMVVILSVKLFRRKIIVHYRGGNFDIFFFSQSPLFQKLILAVLNRVDCIIVQANCLRSMFTEITTRPRIDVLYNGVALPSVNYQCRGIARRSQQRLTLFFLGHLAYSKGIYDLARVMQRLVGKYEIHLTIAGSELYRRAHRKTVRAWLTGEALEYFDRNADDIENFLAAFMANSTAYNTDVLGIVNGDAKRAAFCSADVFVLPSYTEGFSMAVLEAMAYGLPVITTDVGAMPEVVADGVNGRIVKAGDQVALEHAILHFYMNREDAVATARRNLKYVKESFCIDKIAVQFERILASV